jgi:hypothetical protein
MTPKRTAAIGKTCALAYDVGGKQYRRAPLCAPVY